MSSKEKVCAVQELAEFLRNAAYSEELFHHTDHWLFAAIPSDVNGDVVYEGSLCTHNRVKKQRHHNYLHFRFTETKGLFEIEAKKDNLPARVNDAMDYARFKRFVMELFEVESLYKPPKHQVLKRDRLAKNAPSLQDLMEFMSSFSEASKVLDQPVDWLVYVVHPRDNNGDVSYGGGLWTHHGLDELFPKPYNSLSFSYSKTRGIHSFQAWKNRCPIWRKEKLAFDDFKEIALKLFDCKDA